eukprot:gene4616-840_t
MLVTLALAVATADVVDACNVEPGFDYYGHDLINPKRPKRATSAQECCDVCSSYPGCKFWTWGAECSIAAPPTDCCWVKSSSQ